MRDMHSGDQPPDLPPAPKDPGPPPVVAAALLVIEQVVHRAPGVNAVSTETRHAAQLATSEQPWQRHFSAGPEWKPLDCGWLDGGASMLVLENRGGGPRTTNPTAEEAAAERDRVVELGVVPPVPPPGPPRDMHAAELPRGSAEPLLVSPVPAGLSCRLPPGDPTLYRVRCRHGLSARCVLTLFPL